MRIMMFSKYPPIQGGESAKAFWLAKALAERGNEVDVITNCMEVEQTYRCELQKEDAHNLQPTNVKVSSTVPTRAMKFIPFTNPYTEKLVPFIRCYVPRA